MRATRYAMIPMLVLLGLVARSPEALAATNTWTTVASLPTGTSPVAAATGADGTIYAIGGFTTSRVSTVEAYSPTANTWTTVASMAAQRAALAAAAGADGTIYAIGGRDSGGTVLSTVEAYHPTTNTWTTVASMTTPREFFAAATGADGTIYAIGGRDNSLSALSTVEAYHPATDSWTTVASMAGRRDFLAAATGTDGTIYAIGGDIGNSRVSTVEAYHPATSTWTTVASMGAPRKELAAATGADGTIYAIGGRDTVDGFVKAVEAYHPATNTWTSVASMSAPRSLLAAAAGANGTIYAIGGLDCCAFVSIVEAYHPPNTWTTVAPMLTARDFLAAATGTDGTIYAIGGDNRDARLSTVEAYHPASNTWTSVASMGTPREFFAAAPGADGTIYAIGGDTGSARVNTVEAYHPTTNTWTPVASMAGQRGGLAAVTGADGTIYAIGGRDSGGTALSTVEAYNTATNTWTSLAPLHTARGGLAAAAGTDGTIYAIGGFDCCSRLSTVEAYHPATNTWTTVASMTTGKNNLAAATGADGTIYVIGGENDRSYLSTVEAYHPTTNNWTTAAPMATAHDALAVAVGADGTIYAIGGHNGGGYLSTVEAYGLALVVRASAHNADSTPYAMGTWTRQGVTVSWQVIDVAAAGIGLMGGCTTTTITADTGGTTLTCSVTNNAGAQAVVSTPPTMIDKTPPSLFGAPITSPNDAGWYRRDVTIGWTCSDTLSGVNGPCPTSSTLTGEGLGLTANTSVSDNAGNTTLATSSPVNIDRTPPVTVPVAPQGWNNSSVTVALNATDNLSGVAASYYILDSGQPQSYSGGISITADGVHTLTYWSVDKAGNTEDNSQPGKTIAVKIDRTAPTISNANAPGANSNGWNNTSVTVTFTCADALSGIQSCAGSPTSSGTSTLSTEGLGQLVTGTAVDNAGNTATDPVVLNIDETAPTITGSVFPAPNANGWNTTTVSISFSCADPRNASNGTPGSGIASCAAPTALSTEGAGQSVTGTATDAAGKSASTIVGNLNVDKMAPTIALASRTPAANASGWNNRPVTVTWNCTDGLSGPVSPTVSVTISTEGANQLATGTCMDKAGNTASATLNLNIDLTPPSLTPGVSPNPALLNGSATASANASDALSGVAFQRCAAVATGSAGTQTVGCIASDKAGNTASVAASYAVVYGQKLGYNTTTQYRSGATIPIALQLRDAHGNNVSSASIAVKAVDVINSSGTVVRAINAAFIVSRAQVQYHYDLDTTGLIRGSYTLRFTAGSDPTTHLAPFLIK